MKTSRRRFIGIVAAMSSLPACRLALATTGRRWQGQALGAEASLLLHHPDPEEADAAINASLREIRRLEQIFSLFRADAAIATLNRDGRLAKAPPEMLELLEAARRLSALSDGAFDITVQPLWEAYAKGGECEVRAATVRDLIDWRGVIVEGTIVRLAKPGMAITLNGIAQGYITDRIADLLRHRGFTRALVHMGEYRGLGRRDDGEAWQVGIGDPRSVPGIGDVVERVDLADRALATSSPFGTHLACDDTTGVHHLFDPKSGRPAEHWSSVSVVAKRAVIADGLSTTVAVAPAERAQTLLAKGGAERAWLLDQAGRCLSFPAIRTHRDDEMQPVLLEAPTEDL